MFSRSEKEEIKKSLTQTLDSLNELKSLSRENRSLQRYAGDALRMIESADGADAEEFANKLNAIKEILKAIEETDGLNSSLQRRINGLLERLDGGADIEEELNALPEALNDYMAAYTSALEKSGELMSLLGLMKDNGD